MDVYVCEISALGRPERGCTEAHHDGGWNERFEPWFELSNHVEGISKHREDQRPLHRELGNEERGKEHAGQNQGTVQRRVCVVPQIRLHSSQKTRSRVKVKH